MTSWRGKSVDPPLKELIDLATSSAEKITTSPDIIREDVYALIDYVNSDPLGPKECIRILLKQLSHKNPRTILQTIGVIDACVNNCGKRFHIELSSPQFETEIKKLLGRANTLPHLVTKALLSFIKKWGESKEFTGDTQLSLIPSLYRQLKKDGVNFPDIEQTESRPAPLSNDPNVVSSNQEELDIAKAIELSLRESGGRSSTSSMSNNSHSYSNRDESRSSISSGNSMYPSFDSLKASTTGTMNGNSSKNATGAPVKSTSSYQVRALYDFEAAEDNELTFKGGEMIVVLDDSDSNWWRGSNHRGEGLFPSNFVSTNLSDDADDDPAGRKGSSRGKGGKSVQFNEEISVRKLEKEEVEAPITIDVEKIDKLIHLLHVADPTDDRPDSDELLTLEEQCCHMAPLVDEELKKVDRRLASLDSLSSKLVEAMNTYYSLMQNAAPPANPMPPVNHQWNGNVAPSMNPPVYGQIASNVSMVWDPQQQQQQQQQQPQAQPPQQPPL